MDPPRSRKLTTSLTGQLTASRCNVDLYMNGALVRLHNFTKKRQTSLPNIMYLLMYKISRSANWIQYKQPEKSLKITGDFLVVGQLNRSHQLPKDTKCHCCRKFTKKIYIYLQANTNLLV